MYARSTKEYVNANIQVTEDVRYYKINSYKLFVDEGNGYETQYELVETRKGQSRDGYVVKCGSV